MRDPVPGEGLGGRRFLGWTVGPAAAALATLFLAPLAIVVVYAFLSASPRGEPVLPLTLGNLAGSLDPLYLGILLRSLRLALVTTVVCLVVAFPAAWLLRGFSGRTRTILLLALVLPSWTNLLVKNYAWIVLLRREGVINGVLGWAGIIQEPLPLLFNEGAVLVGLVHTFLPFMILPLFVSLEKLDPALLEAARDLGAGAWARFRTVILPAAAPGFAAGAVLVFIPALGAFVTPDLLGGTRGMMVGNLIQNQMLLSRDWPFGSALSLLLMALSLGVILTFLRLSGRKGMERVL
jgi:spermidine/putrescine transport system permease protein